MTHATGTFDVKLTPRDGIAETTLGRISLDKQFHGDLAATSKGEMLTAMTAVLQHSGTMTRGEQ